MSDYKVRKGDNLTKIAKAHNMSLQELLKLNNIDPDKANHIKIGQSIKIKSPQSDPSTPVEQRFSSSIVEAAQEWGNQKKEEITKQAQAAEQAVAKKRDADKKANAEIIIPMKPQLVSRTKAQATSLQEQLVASGYDLGKTGKNKNGIDGDWGSKSEAALQQAQKDGYTLKDGKLIKPNQNTNSVQNNVNPLISTIPGLAGLDYSVMAMGQTLQTPKEARVGTEDPALALATAKVLGTLGINAKKSMPESHKLVLQDQNQYIYDNWREAMEYNWSANNNMIGTLEKQYQDAVKTNDSKKMEEIQKEIEERKQSATNIRTNIDKISKAGGLGQYLRNNPSEKIVIGGNFRYYKDGNKNRFPEGTPSGYASFDRHPDYVGWARSTPLGQVETIYGNNAHSYVFNPETNQIETAVSDQYNFNSIGSELNSKVGKLRTAAGEDEALGKTSVTYRSQLSPITNEESRYINQEQFGQPRKNSNFENWGFKLLEKIGYLKN